MKKFTFNSPAVKFDISDKTNNIINNTPSKQYSINEYYARQERKQKLSPNIVFPTGNTPTICYENGFIYNHIAAKDIRNIGSNEFNVPNYNEWNTLIAYVGGQSVAGQKLKSTLFNGTDEYGFNALLSGHREDYGFNNGFNYINNTTWWFVANFQSSQYPVTVFSTSLNTNGLFYLSSPESNVGCSIRLFRPITPEESSLPDGPISEKYYGNNLREYSLTKIGTQIWITSNLLETKYNNGDDIPEIIDHTDWINMRIGEFCAYNNDWNNASCSIIP